MNSYTIAEMETEEGDIVIVGYLPFINIGDTLKVFGNMVVHKDYGEQFKVDTFEKILPEGLEQLEKYLANGMIKGIGPSTAKKIIETFGEETINVFKFTPEKLANVKGISKDKAMQMSQDFIENWEVWQIVGFLEKFGIRSSSAKKVYEELGAEAITKIEANPYILIDIVRSIDFQKVDQVAISLGISYQNEKRIQSGIQYALMRISYNGNCCCLKQNLMQFVKELLQIEEGMIETELTSLIALGKVVIEERNEEKWVYLAEFYQAERNIAERIIALREAKVVEKVPHFNKELERIEKNSHIELSDKQKEAIKAINKNNILIITGGPGTGKTTIIKTIIDIYQENDKKVVLCAPTGRAAKRMTETTGVEAKTLHRLLEIGKTEEEDSKYEVNYEVAPIDADVIVVDEMSMVDIFLMNHLLKGVFKGTKLILVGDVDQLPSVGPGSVLKDLISSEAIITVSLNKVFRQAAKSKIILNAHKVNHGENFISKDNTSKEELENLEQDFFYIKESSPERILYQLLSLCTGRLKNYGDYDFFDHIQVLTPTKKGSLGTKELNRTLQQALNPATEESREKKVGEAIFRTGDRVMQIKNNYNIYWEKEIENKWESGSGVFNGELGMVKNIDEENRQVKVLFDDGKMVWYAYTELDQIEHAYAITIHKAQGSEFDVVIVVLPTSSPNLMTRNLLYTGLTRAKKLLVVIGSDYVVQFMITNEDNKKRNTGLEFKLRQLN